MCLTASTYEVQVINTTSYGNASFQVDNIYSKVMVNGNSYSKSPRVFKSK